MTTLTMDGLQVYKDKNKYCVSIAGSMTNQPSITALDNLKNVGEKFFELKDISKDTGKADKYIFKYETPANAKNLLSAKNGHEILKLSLLNEVIKDDMLNQRDVFIPLIHPANIFFMDMKTIRYMYTDNGELYTSKKPALEQYKALIVSMMTKYSYEKMLNAAVRKDILQKHSNVFLIQIEKCKTIEEMQKLLDNRLNKTESDFFLFRLREENEIRRKATIKLTVTMVCAIISVAILFMILIGL